MSVLSASVNKAVNRFLAVRSGSRRFHREAIGPDVDPQHCFADFLSRVRLDDHRGLEKHYQCYSRKAAMNETSGLTGGYLVPVELQYSILESVAEQSIFRPRAFIQPMSTREILLPTVRIETVQAAGTTPLLGGLKFYWQPEDALQTESEPTFDQVDLVANSLQGYIVSSAQLAEDGGAPLEAHLRQIFGMGIAWYEDYAFLRGDGVGQPMGIVNAPASAVVNRIVANTIQYEDLGAMLAVLLPMSFGHACWAFSTTAVKQVVTLKDSTGRTAWVPNEEPYPGGPLGAIMGMAAYPTEKLPPLGTKGDIVLFDPRLYVVADRLGGLEIAYSAETPTQFFNRQVVWRVLSRVGGRPWFGGTATLSDGTSVASPYVVLN